MKKKKFISIKLKFVYFCIYLTAGLGLAFALTQAMIQYFVSCSDQIMRNYEEFSGYWNELTELDQSLFEYAQSPIDAARQESRAALESLAEKSQTLSSQIQNPILQDLAIITEKYKESCLKLLEKEETDVEELILQYRTAEIEKERIESLYDNFYQAMDSYLSGQLRILEGRRGWLNTAVILIEAGIVCWFIWHVKRFSRHVTVPVQDLTDQTKAIIAGNPHIEMKYCDAVTDELGILNNAFYQMVETNNRNFEQLKRQSVLEKSLAQAKIDYANLQAKLDRIRLRMLQSRVNPHFMFNTLNIIAGLAVEEDAEKTTKITIKTAKYLRYSLVSLDKTVRLKQEFENIRDYLDIQKERFGERIQAQFQIEETCREALIPSMILQPLCENSLVHGMAPLVRATALSVTAQEKEGKLMICVEDDGAGMTGEKLEAVRERLRTAEEYDDTQGIGIVNTYQRLQMFFDRQVTCTVESEPNVRTAVIFVMPLWNGKEESKDEGADCR